MVSIQRYPISSEKELHSIIEREIVVLEDGFQILKHEFQCGDSGTVDFLGIDSGSRLAMIEVKLNEDEKVLFQALRYYDWIDKNRHAIQSIFNKKRVDPSSPPRMILIAKKFSDDFRSLSTLVIPEVELFEYAPLKSEDGKKGLYLHPVSLPKRVSEISKLSEIKDILGYITNKPLRGFCNKVIEELKGLVKEFEEPYATSDYIGFSYKGKLIAYLWKGRNHFDFNYRVFDKNGRKIEDDVIRITEVNQDYHEALTKIKESLDNLGR